MADALSRERLSKYLVRTGNDASRALALYEWNFGAAAALTAVLSAVEIALRNGIHRALTDAFRLTWHRVSRLRHFHGAVESELVGAETRTRKPSPTLPDIIAASNFNLWRELLRPPYAGVFWARRLPIAFPNLTFRRHERLLLPPLHDRVERLQDLRNRIAHHEPSLGSSWERIDGKAAARHTEAMELLHWMDADLARWMEARDSFAEVREKCPEPVAPLPITVRAKS
ncbi:hypothetical protein ACE7GA_26725 (plasmid) [Roseomonas sp. CCTCC AB2023176]|uniref:hypothetical protein n=1 Tax=Roseomonas sp. CCTCC AB2023176 TaxID=3342640 RepID=UPI0035E0C683